MPECVLNEFEVVHRGEVFCYRLCLLKSVFDPLEVRRRHWGEGLEWEELNAFGFVGDGKRAADGCAFIEKRSLCEAIDRIIPPD